MGFPQVSGGLYALVCSGVRSHSYAVSSVYITFHALLYPAILSGSYAPPLIHIPLFVRIRTPRVRVHMPSWFTRSSRALRPRPGPFVRMNEPGGFFALPRALHQALCPLPHHNACQTNTCGRECSSLCAGDGKVGNRGQRQLGWAWPSVAGGKGERPYATVVLRRCERWRCWR